MIHITLRLEQDYQNLVDIPATYQVTGNRFAGCALLFFSFMFGTEAIFLSISSLLQGNFAATIPGTQHMVMAPLGILFLIWGLNQFFVRGELTFDSHRVRCRYRNLAGEHTWSEQIRAYRGIQKKIDSVPGNVASDCLYCIWLRHNKRKRSFRLYKASSSGYWDEQAARYATMFGLPVLE